MSQSTSQNQRCYKVLQLLAHGSPLGYARVSTADPVSLYGGICALVAVLDDHGGRVPSGPSSRWKGMEHDRAASDEVILSGYRFGAVIPPHLFGGDPTSSYWQGRGSDISDQAPS